MNRNRAGEPMTVKAGEQAAPELFVDEPTQGDQNSGALDARKSEDAWQATQDLCRSITSRADTAVLAGGNGLPSLAAGLLG